MLPGTLGASVLWNMLTRKSVMKDGKAILSAGKSVVRVGKRYNMD